MRHAAAKALQGKVTRRLRSLHRPLIAYFVLYLFWLLKQMWDRNFNMHPGQRSLWVIDDFPSGEDYRRTLDLLFPPKKHGIVRLLPNELTGLAAGLAGSRHASDAEAWRAHLLGDFDGRTLTVRRQLGISLGFLGAAVRLRWRDVCQQLCRPVDWAVAKDSRIATLLVLVAASAVASLRHAGGWARVWEDFEQVGVLVGMVSGAAYGWRKLRGIEPPPPVPQRQGEDK